jgi:glycosyl transferase, family 25
MQGNINTFFAQVVIINLRSRPDRRREMQAQLERIGLSLDAPQVAVFETSKPDDPAGFPTLGARGCFMSHLAVLREARDKGLASVLILEDDLNFCDNFASKFGDVAACLNGNEWGMWYGSYHLDAPPPMSSAPCVRVAPALAVGTSALLAVNGPHIAPLVQYLEAMLRRPAGDPAGGPMHIDGAYCWYRLVHPEAATWLATPPLGHQRSSRTDVHALRWFDRMGWSAFIISSLRRLQNRWR